MYRMIDDDDDGDENARIFYAIISTRVTTISVRTVKIKKKDIFRE